MMSRTTKVALAVLVLLLIAFPLLVNPYMVQVAITTINYSLLGLAFALSMRVGLPRIDVVAWWGVGGYTTALLMNTGMNFWLAALLAGLVTVILAGFFYSFASRYAGILYLLHVLSFNCAQFNAVFRPGAVFTRCRWHSTGGNYRLF